MIELTCFNGLVPLSGAVKTALRFSPLLFKINHIKGKQTSFI